MSRAQQVTDILALDRQLSRQQARLIVSNREQLERLRKVPPLMLVGGGLGAGLVTGWVASRGRGVGRLCLQGLHFGRLVGSFLPMLFSPH